MTSHGIFAPPPVRRIAALDQRGMQMRCPQLISIYALCAMFVVATLPVNMGVLAFVGAFLVGTLVAGMSTKEIIAGFPAACS